MNKEFYNAKYFRYLFFLVIGVSGIFIFPDYGVNTDEVAQRDMGLTTWNYVVSNDKTIFDFFDRHHGVAFEVLLVAVEKVFHLDTWRDIILSRHLVTFLYFFAGLIIFYLLLKKCFKREDVSLLGVAMLLFSPRIFGDAFHNSKDIPFMVTFIWAVFLMVSALEKRRFINYVWLALVVAVLTNIRVMGMMMIPITVFFMVAQVVAGKERVVRQSLLIFSFVLLTVLFFIGSWPYLWTDPAGHFAYVFNSMKRYEWTGVSLFMGSYFRPHEISWMYLPVWIGITTPVLFLMLFFSGAVLFVGRVLKSFATIFGSSLNITVASSLAIIFGSYATLVLFRSVLYDAWRHVFYFAPFILIVGLYAFVVIQEKARALKFVKFILPVWMFLQCGYIAAFYILYHPFQNCYFNQLIPHGNEYLRNNFEMEYWGLSTTKGIEFIVNDHPDKEGLIVVSAGNGNVSDGHFILPEKERKRIRYSKSQDTADYFMTTFRYHGEKNVPSREKADEVFTIRVLDNKILAVYRFKVKSK